MIEICCGGACQPINPGGAGAWGFVVLEGDAVIHCAHGSLGRSPEMTSNVAEYSSLLEALKWLYRQGRRGAVIYMDSQLVVNQVNGKWAVRAKHLDPFAERCKAGMRFCCVSELKWHRREYNFLADEECQLAYAACNMGKGAG